MKAATSSRVNGATAPHHLQSPLPLFLFPSFSVAQSHRSLAHLISSLAPSMLPHVSTFRCRHNQVHQISPPASSRCERGAGAPPPPDPPTASISLSLPLSLSQPRLSFAHSSPLLLTRLRTPCLSSPPFRLLLTSSFGTDHDANAPHSCEHRSSRCGARC